MISVFLLLILQSTVHNVLSVEMPLIIGHLTQDDKLKLQKFFEHSYFSVDDLNTYYSVLGLDAIEKIPDDRKHICSKVYTGALNPAFAHARLYLSGKHAIQQCKVDLVELKTMFENTLSATPSIEDLYHVVMAMHDAGLPVDSAKIIQVVTGIKAKDSSASTMAYMFQVVASLNLSRTELQPYMSAVDDVLRQADELDGKMLFFDRGLYTTALVTRGISDLIKAHGSIGTISQDKLIKLINFVYNRVHSNNLRAAAHLIDALKAISTNPHVALVAVKNAVDGRFTTAGSLSHGGKSIRLQLVNLWGDVVYTPAELTLTAGGLFAVNPINHAHSLLGPAKRGVFTAGPGSSYEFALSELPPVGRYELEIAAKWTKSAITRQLLGVDGVTMVPLRVLVDAQVTDTVLSLSDSVHHQHLRDISLNPGEPFKGDAVPLEPGHQLSITLRLVDAHNPQLPLIAHQVFLQLTHVSTGQSITFVMKEIKATGMDLAKAYQYRLDPDFSSDDFDNLAGIYNVELLVGDELIRNPITWHMLDVNLHFNGPSGSDSARRQAEAVDASRPRTPSAAAMKRAVGPSSLVGSGPSRAKPGIEHIFREPEPRASRMLSAIFTVACAIPLLGLLIAWAVLGVNIWNFRFYPSNLVLHGGLIAIFCLYYIYWCYLNMFTTLAYLAVLAIPTFLAGMRVLRAQIAARQSMKH